MAHQSEATFKKFTSKEASAYNANRKTYPLALYDIIFDYHASTSPSGSFHTLIDLGCGPGNSTKPLTEKFAHVIGVDPSPGMIDTAQKNYQENDSRVGGKVDFLVGRAEDMGGVDIKADMITAATAVSRTNRHDRCRLRIRISCSFIQLQRQGHSRSLTARRLITFLQAHWFDMPAFWASASRILKSGGTVALWSFSSVYPHPSMPEGARLKGIMDRIEKEDLAPFEAEGNRICRNHYDDLVLPWQCDPPVEVFSQERFLRKDWDRDGLTEGAQDFFSPSHDVPIDAMSARLGTASMVIRWREAYPELAHTKDDVVAKGMRELREVSGRSKLDFGSSGVLLLFKKF